jgi:hypothetical protein
MLCISDQIVSMVTLFFSSFFIIMLLGVQSQLVKNKEVLPSFCTALMVGSLQLFLYKATPNAGLAESACYIIGGALGLVSSIYVHNLWLKITGQTEK